MWIVNRIGDKTPPCFTSLLILNIEAYHLQFMKKTLGVKVTTNSCVVYAETGRFPLHIDIYLCMIKYWIKILNTDVKK